MPSQRNDGIGQFAPTAQFILAYGNAIGCGWNEKTSANGAAHSGGLNRAFSA
jgi:hypothetical protein